MEETTFLATYDYEDSLSKSPDNSGCVYQIVGNDINSNTKTRTFFKFVSLSLEQGYYQTCRTGINDLIGISYDGTDYAKVLTPGDYNRSQFIAMLQALFNGISGVTVAITYSTVSKKLAITNSSLLDVSILGAETTCEELIGIGTDDVLLAAGTITTLPDVMSLNSVRSIDVHSSLCSLNSYTSYTNSRSDLLARVPIETLGGIIQYSNYSSPWVEITNNHTFISFYLTNQRGEALDNNGRGYSIGIMYKKVTNGSLVSKNLQELIADRKKMLVNDISK